MSAVSETATSVEKPDTIIGQLDRFEITKVLGEGAQGVVYLGRDPHLQRQVAIKSIKQDGDSAMAQGEVEVLLREARVISRFQHPNIVSIYEIGFQNQTPYLVLEYVDGPLLSAIIKKHPDGTPPDTALQLAINLLDGLAFAHEHEIIHGDLKPANVLVSHKGIAKITDFGIARRAGEQIVEGEQSGAGMAGSPRYMAPEYITDRLVSAAGDQFAAGIILFQLFTGKQPFGGKTLDELFASITAGKFPSPSSLNSELDSRLDTIVARALAVQPEQRFETIGDLRQALRDYQLDLSEPARVHSTAKPAEDGLRKLRQRLRGQKDLPTLSASISNLNGLFAGNQHNAAAIAAVISKDLALTTKVLRIANSAYVPNAAGEITNLSHAVMMLGFQAVREIAASLMMIDILPGDRNAAGVKEQLARSLFSATLARKLAIVQGEAESDSCFLVAMFYRFGRLLVSYHLPEEFSHISEKIAAGESELQASRAILGYGYAEIGEEISADWSLPEFLVDSLKEVDFTRPADFQHLRPVVYGSLTCDVTDLLATVEAASSRRRLSNLCSRYIDLIDISSDELEETLQRSKVEFLKFCSILKIDIDGTGIHQAIENWDGHFPEEFAEEPDENQTEFSSLATTMGGGARQQKISVTLVKGIQEIKQSLSNGNYEFDELIRKILATIYYGIECHRVVLCRVLEPQQKVKARYAVGKQVNPLLKSFQFPLSEASGVFGRAISTGQNTLVGDVAAHAIIEPMPDWYRQRVAGNCFAILPFQSAGKTQGFIYIDHPQVHYLDHLSPPQHALLSTLRDLCAEAYRRRHQQMRDAARARSA